MHKECPETKSCCSWVWQTITMNIRFHPSLNRQFQSSYIFILRFFCEHKYLGWMIYSKGSIFMFKNESMGYAIISQSVEFFTFSFETCSLLKNKVKYQNWLKTASTIPQISHGVNIPQIPTCINAQPCRESILVFGQSLYILQLN